MCKLQILFNVITKAKLALNHQFDAFNLRFITEMWMKHIEWREEHSNSDEKLFNTDIFYEHTIKLLNKQFKESL